MSEIDDLLVGDPVWELFPSEPATLARRFRAWAEAALLIIAAWLLNPHAGVLVACFEASFRDFRSGMRIFRTIPDKEGGRICALFADAWGTWKLGAAAFVMTFVAAILEITQHGRSEDFPAPAMTAMLLWMGGFFMAAVLTAVGLVQAYRSGMRIWIGEGINQARTLLLGMLMVGFTCVVLLPLCFLLAAKAPAATDGDKGIMPLLIGEFSLMLGAPVILLIILDWFTRHIVADRPAKFGPKVPTLGKWD